MRTIAVALLAAGAMFFVGCQKPSGGAASSGGVAIIDLDLIAARLGSDKQMVQAISARQNALHQKLAELARSYNEQITEKKKQTTAAPAQQPADGGVQLASFEQAAVANLNQAKRQAAQDLATHQAQLVRQFREHVRPAARQVARQRGLSVIVTKNDSVLFDFVDTVDITEGVIAALQAPAPVATPQ